MKTFIFCLTFLICCNTVAQDRFAFITSVSGTADFSTWPDSSGFSGTIGADQVCKVRAAFANFENPINYVALLSDSQDDAYCRLLGFTGKRSNNCGQGIIAEGAGPWKNSQGENLAEALPEMIAPNYRIYRPVQYDEFGQFVRDTYFTATNPDGTLNTNDSTCGDFSNDSSGFVALGNNINSASGLFKSGSGECSTARRLICFELTSGGPLTPERSNGRLAFVTDARGNGDLRLWPLANGASNGTEAADSICRTSAANAGLPRPQTFKGWISDGFVDARDRFDFDGPLHRPDGVKVANNLGQLENDLLSAPINQDENGTYIANWAVWSGTENGFSTANTCNGWTDPLDTSNGTIHFAHSTVIALGSTVGCDFGGARLYCLQDIDLVFSNGFE